MHIHPKPNIVGKRPNPNMPQKVSSKGIPDIPEYPPMPLSPLSPIMNKKTTELHTSSQHVITEELFRTLIREKLSNYDANYFKSVSGPGRSGAIASVYASYILGIPFIPFGQKVPHKLNPHLVIDTAEMTGKTLKKAAIKMGTGYKIAVIRETHKRYFWFEEQ